MLLFLIACCLLLVGSDLGLFRTGSDEPDASGWVRLKQDGREGRFFRIRPGEPLRDFLAREMPNRDVLDDGSCAGLVLESGIEIQSGEAGGEPGRVSCGITPLPERVRYFLGLPMDLNRAGPEELTLLPGIGEGLAGRIRQVREERGGFTRWEDLLSIPGIGTKILERIKGHATVGP